MAQRDPIAEGWLARGAPMDFISTSERDCPICVQRTRQDRYRVILGRYGGLGAPFFVRAFARSASTKGKIGRKSVWDFCTRCGSFLPYDDSAKEDAASLGMPNGFINQGVG